MDLKNAVVLVTGGSCGIGLETARLLRQRGARVAICARHEDMLESAAKEIDALPIIADVSKEDDVLRMIGAVVKEYADYNVLINNAGFGAFAPLVDLTADEFFRVWQTNVLGAMLCGARIGEALRGSELREHRQHLIDRRPAWLRQWLRVLLEQVRGARADRMLACGAEAAQHPGHAGESE